MTGHPNFHNYTVFDIESSGVDPEKDQIIEFCMVRVRDGEPVLVFNTLINFQDELNPKITELTGHTIKDLEGGITEGQLAYALCALIQPDELLVAHNAPFDLEFLEVLFNKHVYKGVYRLPNRFLDTLTIARDRMQYPHKLTDVCRRYGITFEAHSAYEDTFATMELVAEMHKQQDISGYVNVLGYMRKYGIPKWYPAHAILHGQGKEEVTRNVKQRPTLKPPKKVQGAVVTANPARKKRPEPVVNETTLPTGFMVNPRTLHAVDAFLDRQLNPLYVPLSESDDVLRHLYELDMNISMNEIHHYESGDSMVFEWKESAVMLDSTTKHLVDGFLTGNVDSIYVAHDEFNAVTRYLLEKGIDESKMYSYDDGDSAVIEWTSNGGKPKATDPFANYSRVDEDPFAPGNQPIEISEDDLPF